MTRVKIANNARTIGEKKEIISLTYYLVLDELALEYEGEKMVLPSYGIEIVSEKYKKGKMFDSESEVYENISPCEDKVIDLIRYYADMFLSPVHLLEVVDEHIEEYIEDFDRMLQEQYQKECRVAI
jgi:hypothetical protein